MFELSLSAKIKGIYIIRRSRTQTHELKGVMRVVDGGAVDVEQTELDK